MANGETVEGLQFEEARIQGEIDAIRAALVEKGAEIERATTREKPDYLREMPTDDLLRTAREGLNIPNLEELKRVYRALETRAVYKRQELGEVRTRRARLQMQKLQPDLVRLADAVVTKMGEALAMLEALQAKEQEAVQLTGFTPPVYFSHGLVEQITYQIEAYRKERGVKR